MKLRCPRCQQKLSVPDSYAGKGVRCPACNRAFNVPKPKTSTEALVDKSKLDLESLAALEHQSSEFTDDELRAAEAAEKARKTAKAKGSGRERTCPSCGQQTKVADPYVEVLCSHCWTPIPALMKPTEGPEKESTVLRRRALGVGGFYAELVTCLTYPIPALGSLLTAAGVGVAGGLVPVAVMTGLSNLMQQSNVGTALEGQKANLSGASMLLMAIFAFELFVFSAIALHLFLDTLRASSIGTPAPPSLSWAPNQWGKSFAGYLVLVAYYVLVTIFLAWLTLEDGVSFLWQNRDLMSILDRGGKSLVWGLAILSFGVPMNIIGFGLGTVLQAINPARVGRSIIKTHVHYVFLVLMLCFYGIIFGSMFWAVVHDWFIPQISRMAAGSKEGNLVQVALPLLSWGGVVALYFYGTYVMGRLFGLFARTFRKDLEFGTR